MCATFMYSAFFNIRGNWAVALGIDVEEEEEECVVDYEAGVFGCPE